MSESVEIQMARVQEQLKTLVDGNVEARQSRKELYQQVTAVSTDISSIKTRLDSVEATLAGQSPTIEEFIRIKQQVTGAGRMGRILWGVGGILIGIAFTTREFVRDWLMR